LSVGPTVFRNAHSAGSLASGRANARAHGGADGHANASVQPVHVQGRIRDLGRGPRIATTWVPPSAQWRIPGAYDKYFAVYPIYVDESAWVTDWIMVDLLVDEEMSAEAQSSDAPPVDARENEGRLAPIDSREKESLRAEVDRDIEQTAAGEPEEQRIADAFADPSHVFVVTKDIVVTEAAGGTTCALTRADLMRATAPLTRGVASARMTVVASKRGSCAASTVITVAGADLEQFERDLQHRVDRGAAEAQEQGGPTADQSAGESL
jgi:hypothetical protein